MYEFSITINGLNITVDSKLRAHLEKSLLEYTQVTKEIEPRRKYKTRAIRTYSAWDSEQERQLLADVQDLRLRNIDKKAIIRILAQKTGRSTSSVYNRLRRAEKANRQYDN